MEEEIKQVSAADRDVSPENSDEDNNGVPTTQEERDKKKESALLKSIKDKGAHSVSRKYN